MKSGCSFGSNNNEVVFVAAALGIKLNIQENTQQFFGGLPYARMQEKYTPNWPCHQDDITCVDVCGDKEKALAVTGETGAKSTVHVWDTNTMQSVNRFDLGDKCKGVASVAISPCARYISTVDQSNDHNVSVYNINKKKPIFSVSAGNDAIAVMKWSRKVNDLRFAAITSRSIQFWNPADSGKKLFKNGAFGPNNTQTKFNCVFFDDDGVCYAGGANGAVHCWDQRGELGLVLKAHSGECTSVGANQGTLVSSGKDHKICVHTYSKGSYEFVKQIDLETRYLASSIDFLDGCILIGHDNGVIITCDLETEAQQILGVSHCDGEVWGLEVNPEKGTFYTSGDDNQFMEFDLFNKRIVRKGKVFSTDYNNGKPYELTKIRSTASTLSSCPPH
jgi:WD40 repeat protein